MGFGVWGLGCLGFSQEADLAAFLKALDVRFANAEAHLAREFRGLLEARRVWRVGLRGLVFSRFQPPITR